MCLIRDYLVQLTYEAKVKQPKSFKLSPAVQTN